MGKRGYREKWIKGKLYLFCTQCLDHKLPEEFSYATYVNANGGRQLRSACNKCASAQNKQHKVTEDVGKYPTEPKFKIPRI